MRKKEFSNIYNLFPLNGVLLIKMIYNLLMWSFMNARGQNIQQFLLFKFETKELYSDPWWGERKLMRVIWVNILENLKFRQFRFKYREG